MPGPGLLFSLHVAFYGSSALIPADDRTYYNCLHVEGTASSQSTTRSPQRFVPKAKLPLHGQRGQALENKMTGDSRRNASALTADDERR